MTHVDQLDDAQLTNLAATAFRIGLSDGRVLSAPRNSRHVMAELGGYERTILQRRKFRQVYGAGFDIARSFVN